VESGLFVPGIKNSARRFISRAEFFNAAATPTYRIVMALKLQVLLTKTFVILASCLSALATAHDSVRIMPLGDSITVGIGSANYNGYRKPLYLKLINDGYDIDFVGTQSDGDFADCDHEGHQGWEAEGGTGGGILPNVYNWLTANPADIVLLHIGTNDITVGGQDPNEISAILDEIDRFSEDTKVIVALIINRQTYSPETTQFNNEVKDMASSRIAAGDDIVIVDMENVLNYSTDMYDNLHPNDSGYVKMADVWYKAITGCLKDGLYETNQRLEFISSSKFDNFAKFYIANGWRLDVNDNFAVKMDFHYSGISSRCGWVGINISDGAKYVAVSAGSDANSPYYYYDAIVDGNLILEQEPRTSDDGTLYFRYDTVSKSVYLSHIGFDNSDAYHWQTTSNPLSGQWSSSVDIAIGGGADGVYLPSGRAYMENFEVTDAGVINWPPKTDLDHNGYIELADLAELCEHWLQTGTDIDADFQFDGVVDFRDFSIFGLAW
jgi:lysophospholipase L1-like esterase